ncbi:hypothetical protein ACM257_15150 [Alteromonas macleodii]|uniref:hypothetical protein n=1 Tax=Alteromonas macleodii TaxID=28108 RepID=UPI0039F69369
MISLVVLSVIFSLYFYVEAFKWGMSAKKWAIAGFVLGPSLTAHVLNLSPYTLAQCSRV